MADKQIIIIPGIMGSDLQYGTYRVWPPTETALWMKGLNVTIEKLGDITNEEIGATSISNFFYNNLYEFLTELTPKVDRFSYDWRKNNFSHVKALKKLIDPEADEVILVAHSMGGIIAKLLLTQNKEDSILKNITTLITIGTPWNGSAEAYITLKYGMGIKYILGLFKSVIPNFQSIYQLLPNQQYIINNKKDGFIEKRNWNNTYKEYVEILKKHGLDYNEILVNLYNQMTIQIPEWIEHHEIIGYNKCTLTSIKEKGVQIEGKFGDGDGTVPLHSAISCTKNKYFVKGGHKWLPGNAIVKEIIKKIVDEKKSEADINNILHLQSYNEVLSNGFKGKIVRVACPVNVSLIDESGEILYGDITKSNTDNLFNFLIDGKENVRYLNEDVYFILNDKEDFTSNKLEVQAYEEGAVSISIEEYKNGELSKVAKFKTFNMDNLKNAEIIINKEVDNCNVTTLGNENKNVERIIIEDFNIDTDVSLPRTNYNFDCKNIIEVDEKTFLAMGNVEIVINKVIKGTYDVLDTFYSINGKHLKVIGESGKDVLDLEKGNNIIKVYSTDIFGNVELMSERNIYYIDEDYNRFPKLKIKAEPGRYTLITEFRENKELDKLNLKVPDISFLFDDNDGVTFNYIEIKDKIREIKLKVTDFFGTIISEPFVMNEKLLNLILESQATIIDYNKFLKLLRLDKFKTYKTTQNNSSKTYKTLENTRVTNADSLEFKNDIIAINIDKMKEYKVMFSNLREYISFSDDEEYQQQFSIFSNSTSGEITDLKLKVYLAIESNSDTWQFSNIKEIPYEIEDKKYSFSVSTTEIQHDILKLIMVDGDSINKVYFLIKIDNEKETLIRTCELIIK